jgi:hypothetical protein
LLLHEPVEARLHRSGGLVERLVLTIALPYRPALVESPDEWAIDTIDPELDPSVVRGPSGDRRVQLLECKEEMADPHRSASSAFELSSPLPFPVFDRAVVANQGQCLDRIGS